MSKLTEQHLRLAAGAHRLLGWLGLVASGMWLFYVLWSWWGWWSSPHDFTSQGRMIVAFKQAIPGGFPDYFSEETAGFLGTQAALMQSGRVLSRARARVVSTKQNPVAIPVSLNVSVIPKTTLFVLRATAKDPQYAQAFLQGAMEEYITLKKEMRSETSDSVLAGLTEEILRLDREVKKANDELTAYQTTNSVVLVQDVFARQPAVLIQKLIDLRTEAALLASQPASEEKRKDLGLKISLLEEALKTSDAQAPEISRKASEFEKLKSSLERVTALYKRLLDTMLVLDVQKQIALDNINIIERASPSALEPFSGAHSRKDLSLLGLLISGLLLFTGRCLAGRRHLPFCFVVAALECVVFPVGTVLGILTLMVLWRELPPISPPPELPETQ